MEPVSAKAIHQCPNGIPKAYIDRALPLEIKGVHHSETYCLVTVAFQGSLQDEISAFSLSSSYKAGKGKQIKTVVLVRNNFEDDWDYDCKQDLEINKPVVKEVWFEIDKLAMPFFTTLQSLRDHYHLTTQNKSGSLCPLY